MSNMLAMTRLELPLLTAKLLLLGAARGTMGQRDAYSLYSILQHVVKVPTFCTHPARNAHHTTDLPKALATLAFNTVSVVTKPSAPQLSSCNKLCYLHVPLAHRTLLLVS